jgi:uncharacterized protein YecE (DUF72 family)
MKVKVGTSGYSFKDWKGAFYPDNIKSGEMLDCYVNYFMTVELNTTYYRIPHPAMMTKIVRKAPAGFDFMVKVPQTFTHQRQDIEKDTAAFSEALRPIAESGKLAGLLAQFPFSFKFDMNNLDYLSICRDAVAPHDLFVEFRHDSWVNRAMYDRLRTEKIGYVSVDEPQLRGLLEPYAFATTDIGYVRLHGRNAGKWWSGGQLRYDYDYSEEELKSWRDKILRLQKNVKRIYVYFNNCHEGQAAKNAQEFMQLINPE